MLVEQRYETAANVADARVSTAPRDEDDPFGPIDPFDDDWFYQGKTTYHTAAEVMAMADDGWGG